MAFSEGNIVVMEAHEVKEHIEHLEERIRKLADRL